jgi:uncharacterized protein involved in type VI secretion and phage assembly
MQTDPMMAGESEFSEQYWGKYRATVVDNADPDGLGRLSVTIPVLDIDKTGWAMPCVSYAGPHLGSYAMPPVGAGVWIEFEHGNASLPVWTGCFWGDKEAPVVPPSQEFSVQPPATKIWRSEQGLTTAYDDEAKSITVTDSDGQNRIVIDVQSGTVTVKGQSRVVLDSPRVDLGNLHALHRSVFGDLLCDYLTEIVTLFNAHAHPGELALAVLPVTPAPAVPQMAPPTGLLSDIVSLD